MDDAAKVTRAAQRIVRQIVKIQLQIDEMLVTLGKWQLDEGPGDARQEAEEALAAAREKLSEADSALDDLEIDLEGR